MAMKKCKECKGKVSTKATSCPHCGFQVGATEVEISFTQMFFSALRLILLLLFLYLLFFVLLDAFIHPENKLHAVANFIADGIGMLLGFLGDFLGWLSNSDST